jgi:hypothetical protein
MKQLPTFARLNLAKGGKLYFEIHYRSGKTCWICFPKTGFREVQLKKDLSVKRLNDKWNFLELV